MSLEGNQGRRQDWKHGLHGLWRTCFAVLCLMPLLGGCLPGYHWGADDSDSGFASDGGDGPALNRTYKSSFLSLQVPSLGSSRLRSQLMPDSGPSILTSFATVEARKPPSREAPQGFNPRADNGQAFEPIPLPAAQALQNFYSALAALAAGRRQQPVTVLHLGDDRILDDHFAGALRESLVNRFGNAGRGLMTPGLYPVRGMKVDRSGAWSLSSAAAGDAGPFGVTGARMTSSSKDAWLRFTSAQGPFDWLEVTLMTGPRQGTAIVTADTAVKLIPTNTPGVNQTFIRISSKAQEIVIRPRGDGDVTVLSVATGSNAPGISYANLALPGAAAWTPGKWTADFAANDLQKLNPDLIVLGYGTHEGFTDNLDIREYEVRLRLVVDQLKEWAPQASILVVGPPDAARLPGFAGLGGSQVCRSLDGQEIADYSRMLERNDERLARWHAPPRLEAVRAVLRRTASTSGAFFWDWAKSMGGSCSVHAWTSLKPPMAAGDHVTLTEAGNDRSARFLFAELMAGYDAFQRGLQAKAQAIAASTAPLPPSHPAKPAKKQRI